jgi:hydrogenase nickel incorporation protein HypA/HybF
MHEMGITQQILSQAFAAAEQEHATRINEIRVSVGELTEVVETALQFSFEVLRRDTIAEDAVLDVTVIAPYSRCTTCGHEFEHDRFDMTCPSCGGFFCENLRGRELRIDSIDIETDEDAGEAAGTEEE